MNNNLLTTKFQIPALRQKFVRRERLFARFNEGRRHKLTLVSAPAGYGKTTLISSWASSLNIPAAWVSLDSSDNDGARFLGYLYTALSAACPEFDSQTLPIPDSLQAEQIAPVATLIINELSALTAEALIVLDDYHAITNDNIHALMRYLIEHLPPHVHCVLLTRIDPPLPLSRWRGRGELHEVRSDDLRFTTDEIQRFIDQVANVSLEADSLVIIEAKTEGWVTGLKLTALSLMKQPDVRQFVLSFDGHHEYIADYLTDEVLASQPESLQAFMLQTSILDYLTGSLCEALTGRGDSQMMLEKLERENLFLSSMDNVRHWYRYHQLFRELLKKRLHLHHPEQTQALYQAASLWHEQHGHINEAIHYAQINNDTGRVIQLIEAHILDTIFEGEFYRAQTWLELVEETSMIARPVLCLAQAWISIRALEIERVYTLIRRAEHLAEADPPASTTDRTLVSDHIATIRAVVARTEGQSPAAQQALIQQALAALSPDNEALRDMLHLRLGFCYLDLGREQEADRIFEQLIAAEEAAHSTYNLYGAVYARMIIAYIQGRLHDVNTLCQGMLDQAAHARRSPWQQTAVHGFAHIGLGFVHLEWNELDSAEFNLRRGLALNTANGSVEIQIKGEYALGRLYLAQGKEPQSLDIRRLHSGRLPHLAEFAGALQAHLWLMQARSEPDNTQLWSHLAQWAGTQALAPVAGYDQDWQIKRQLIYVRVLLVLRERGKHTHLIPDLNQVLDFLEDLQEAYSPRGWIDSVIDMLIVRALVLDAMGATGSALDVLHSALVLAEPRGYTRIFLDEGEHIVSLLYKLAEYSEYAGHLLAQHAQAKTPAQAVPNLIEPLTSREIEVLALIAQGLTNQEIGQELSISLGTVKRHTANINGKLNAHNRTEAVAIARSLSILD